MTTESLKTMLAIIDIFIQRVTDAVLKDMLIVVRDRIESLIDGG